jgi:LEA14-like dessication related protein
MNFRPAALALASLLVCSCASLSPGDPLQVSVSGLESLPGEGMELRLLVKLRVQNPNDAPLDYDGAYLQLDVEGRSFATGVSDQRGTVPRFGESIIAVPVTVPVLGLLRQVLGLTGGQPVDSIRYELRGKLNSTAFRTTRFHSEGVLSCAAPLPC